MTKFLATLKMLALFIGLIIMYITVGGYFAEMMIMGGK